METPETTKRRKFLNDNINNNIRYWIGKRGITSSTVGYKTSRGKKSNELCIIVGVIKKLPKEEVIENSLFLIPEFITFYVDDIAYYVKTDVIQTGEPIGE